MDAVFSNKKHFMDVFVYSGLTVNECRVMSVCLATRGSTLEYVSEFTLWSSWL